MSSWLRRLSRERPSRESGEPYKDGQYGSYASQDETKIRPGTTGDAFVAGPVSSRTRAVSHPTHVETLEARPDGIIKAFNDALRPYQDQIDELKTQLEDSLYRLQGLEDERADMHAWIDKRGLRADVPPSIAQSMNADPAAAQTLNYQLDRKMTVLNHDLHRLQDSLATHLPTATFATTLVQLLPSIEDLAALPCGSPLAFELLIKLGGNLNSHGGEEGWNNEADANSRADFYSQLDTCMTDVVKTRLKDGEASASAESGGPVEDGIARGEAGVNMFAAGAGQGDNWAISRDIKRLDKTGAFLRSKLGLREYFPRSLELMRRGEAARAERTLPLQGRGHT